MGQWLPVILDFSSAKFYKMVLGTSLKYREEERKSKRRKGEEGRRKRKMISMFAGILDHQLVSLICLFLNIEEPCGSIVTAKSISLEVFQMKYEKWSIFQNNIWYKLGLKGLPTLSFVLSAAKMNQSWQMGFHLGINMSFTLN